MVTGIWGRSGRERCTVRRYTAPFQWGPWSCRVRARSHPWHGRTDLFAAQVSTLTAGAHVDAGRARMLTVAIFMLNQRFFALPRTFAPAPDGFRIVRRAR